MLWRRMFKRKRTPDDDWSVFVDEVKRRAASIDAVTRTTASDTTLLFKLVSGARIPTNLVDTLCGATYDTRAWIVHDEATLLVHVACNPRGAKKSCASEQPPSKTFTADTALREQLRLRNHEVFDQLDTSIEQVYTAYHDEMAWGGTEQPYEIIYHKKHSQIITRFQFSTATPSVKMIPMPPLLHMATPWIEYNAKQQTFWLVIILKECL